MLYLIKNKNVFSKFCRDTYIINYQKRGFLYIYFLNFLNFDNKFLEVFYINKIIYAKFLIMKTDFTGEFTKILTLVIFSSLYKNINLYLFYINNA